MQKQIKKYRPLIYLLLPLYINLFFLPQFIHYHHSEVNSIQPESAILHLHTINGHEENHHHEESGEHLDDCTNHEHEVQSNTFLFITLTKSLQLNYNFRFFTLKDYTPKTSIRELKQRVADDLPSKPMWEKYVYNAANLSPPLV